MATDEHGLPDWFWRNSPLSMDPLKGPDEQYRAGARDMLALIMNHTDVAEQCGREGSGDSLFPICCRSYEEYREKHA